MAKLLCLRDKVTHFSPVYGTAEVYKPQTQTIIMACGFEIPRDHYSFSVEIGIALRAIVSTLPGQTVIITDPSGLQHFGVEAATVASIYRYLPEAGQIKLHFVAPPNGDQNDA
ncbi:MAG: hypothetical protein PHW95_00310 [Patescibacteria group bacterium]|nr:hypothetical protein [Patescibacteria group bacterium]